MANHKKRREEEEKKKSELEQRYKIVRTKDCDGMGGFEWEYKCGSCGKYVDENDKFCKHCGLQFHGLYLKDSCW